MKQNNQGEEKTTARNTRNKKNETPHLLETFFISQLKDIYYAEQHISRAMPKLIEACTTDELREAFEDHLHQTGRHIRRLENVFQMIGQKAEGEKCEAIEGIIKEALKIISETKAATLTRDAALIMAAQKIEHYEIATYGGLVELAMTIGLPQAATQLDKTLLEEEQTDLKLTDIAETCINLNAELEDVLFSWTAKEETADTEE
jgi:ferritin-like metal-binding protein YciE